MVLTLGYDVCIDIWIAIHQAIVEVLFLKAAIYHEPKNIKLEEVPEPQTKGKKILFNFRAS